MHIIQIASECAPFAKVGGLSDVILGLSRELIQLKHTVEIILPKYDCIDYSQLQNLILDGESSFESKYGEEKFQVRIWRARYEEIPIILIEPLNASGFMHRGYFYGGEDDIERFTCFCRATLDYLTLFHPKENNRLDVVHIHDWQTALCALLYQDKYRQKGLDIIKMVFTIHNLEYQGIAGEHILRNVSIDWWYYKEGTVFEDLEKYGYFNLLKSGCIYADHVTTVSPTYAEEAKTPLGGRGLDSCLQSIQDRFSGILNGIDFQYWNPAKDPYLPVKYSSKRFFNNKYEIQKQLRDRLQLEIVQQPIVSCITRLVPQKGISMIKKAIFKTLELGGQFILLGSSPIPEIQKEFEDLKESLSQNKNIHFEMRYNEELSHWIYAGSDFFIVPSLFEPCGLTQMIAMRYGTVPIVRKTGGLQDSVIDVEYRNTDEVGEGVGFVFEFPDENSIDWVLERAFNYWHSNPKEWKKLVKRGMEVDYSWKKPALEYVNIYQSPYS